MSLRDHLRRYNQWAGDLSRAGFALYSSVVAVLCVLVVQLVLGDFDPIPLIGIALGIGIMYYWGDPSSG